MLKRLVDWLFRDTEGRVVIWQMPNLPLWVWIIATVIKYPLKGVPAQIVAVIGSVALEYWGALEAYKGRSRFRKFIGTLVLGLVVVQTVRSLAN